MFTREQIREISKRLSELGIKDTDMVIVTNSGFMDEIIDILKTMQIKVRILDLDLYKREHRIHIEDCIVETSI